MRVAAIDVGTNTVRLLVAERDSGGRLVDVARKRRITRLGQGLDAAGRLEPSAARRTLDAITAFAERARELGAERMRIAGTSALRDAVDASRFAREVEEQTGVPLDVLSGLEEGRLSFVGATSDLARDTYLVCDIGGGSTELTLGRAAPAVSVSLDVGSVRLTERYLRSDPPKAAEIHAACARISEVLAASGFELAAGHGTTLVGVAGTVTTIAALVLGLDAYDPERVHHARLSRVDVEGTVERLGAMRTEEIRRLGPVEPGRADVIFGGSLVLRYVMERWDFPEVVISERDILDGLAASLVG